MQPSEEEFRTSRPSSLGNGEDIGYVDDMGNDGGNDHVHRTILEEGVHSEVREESMNRSIHRGFHQENIRTSKEKPLVDAEDEMKESVRNRKRNGRDRSVHQVPRDEEMTMVVRTAHGDCQNCFRARRIRYNFHSAAEMDRRNGCGAVDLLHNEVRLESSGETSCETLGKSNGVQNRTRIPPLQVDVVYPE